MIVVAGRSLEVRRLGTIDPHRPTLVFLHEGLGCAALWRDFPDRVSAATGLAAIVYSRHGYGQSEPFDAPLTTRFMHDEALVSLPALLDASGVGRAILVGHSDGASIALIYAGERDQRVEAVVALAPHLFVEPITTASIAEISRRFPASDLPQRMAKYHRDPVATFRRWADIWLDPEFARWNIENAVAKVDCPVLALQGSQDEYGTIQQVRRVGELCPDARWICIESCGHSPHLDQPERVLDEVTRFITRLAEHAFGQPVEEHYNSPTE